MRAALLGTMAAWVAVAAVALAVDEAALLAVVVIVAAGFSLLLAAHLVAFALRALGAEVSPCSNCGRAATPSSAGLTRRGFVRILAAFGAAGAASVAGLPGARRVFAQDRRHCNDKTETFTHARCKQAGEDDAASHQKTREEALKKAEEIAGKLCTDQDCGRGSGKKCALAHIEVEFSNEICLDGDQNCPHGSCEVTVKVKAHCRCVGTQCATTNLDPVIDITIEGPAGTDPQLPCKQVAEQLQQLINAVSERVCKDRECPNPPNLPPGTPEKKCKPSRVDAESSCQVVQRQGQRICICRAHVRRVHCKCD